MGTCEGLLTQTAFAAACGRRQPQISKLVKSGKIPVTEDGLIDPKVAGPIMDSLRRQPAKTPKGKLDGPQERARLAKAKADAQEIENAKLRGDLIEAGIVAEVWNKRVANFRTKALSLPYKIATIAATMDDPKEIQGVTKGLIHEMLAELAQGDEPFMEGLPDFLSALGSS